MAEKKIILLFSIICVTTVGLTVTAETKRPTGKINILILENSRIILSFSHESLCGYFVGMLTVRRAERRHHLHFLIFFGLCCIFIPWHSFGASAGCLKWSGKNYFPLYYKKLIFMFFSLHSSKYWRLVSSKK